MTMLCNRRTLEDLSQWLVHQPYLLDDVLWETRHRIYAPRHMLFRDRVIAIRSNIPQAFVASSL